MTDHRRTTGAIPAASETPLPAPNAAATAGGGDEHESHAETNVVRLGFRERPYYDEFLMRTHPSKVFFDAFVLHPVPGGYFPVLVSSVLVDTAVRH